MVCHPDRPVCLVVEDQAIIGMLIEEDVRACGYGVLGPFTSCTGARSAVSERAPDVALVDYQLSDGSCLLLARDLRDRGIPFAVLSGYDGPSGANPGEWSGVPWLRKPVSTERLEKTLRSLLPRKDPCPA